MSMLNAAEEVLQGSGPMHYTDIWKEMAKRGHTSKGKTPWHSVRVLMMRAPEKFEHLKGGVFRLVQQQAQVRQQPPDDMLFEIIM